MDEPAEAGARRELREETGLEIAGPVEPIGFFAKPGRDPRGRTITLAHAAVVRPGEHKTQGGDDAAEAAWTKIGDPIDLAFDHAEILDQALAWLRRGVIDRTSTLALRALTQVLPRRGRSCALPGVGPDPPAGRPLAAQDGAVGTD